MLSLVLQRVTPVQCLCLILLLQHKKYNCIFLYRKKKPKEPNHHFQHLIDLLLSFKSSLMAATPTASSRKFSCLRSKSHTLCSHRGIAHLRAVADTACLPATASNGGTSCPQTLPWGLDPKAATHKTKRWLIQPTRTQRSLFEFNFFELFQRKAQVL